MLKLCFENTVKDRVCLWISTTSFTTRWCTGNNSEATTSQGSVPQAQQRIGLCHWSWWGEEAKGHCQWQTSGAWNVRLWVSHWLLHSLTHECVQAKLLEIVYWILKIYFIIINHRFAMCPSEPQNQRKRAHNISMPNMPVSRQLTRDPMGGAQRPPCSFS